MEKNLSVRDVLVLTISCLSIVCLYTFTRWYLETMRKNRRIFELIKTFRTPSYFPVIGHSLKLIGTPTHIHNNLMRLCFKYGPNFAFWILDRVIIVVGKPEDAEKVLLSQSCLQKFEKYNYTRFIIGNGLFAAPVDIWKRNRKIITTTFNSKILDSYQPIFGRCASIFVNEILPKHVGKKNVNWHEMVTLLNLDAIMQSALGVNLHVQTEPFPYAVWLEGGMRSLFIRMLNVVYYPDFIFFRSNLGIKLLEYRDKIWEFTEKIIAEKKKEFLDNLKNEEPPSTPDEDKPVPLEKRVFLNLLLELNRKGTKFSDENLRDEVSTFITGGTDTTAVTTCFFLLMMGMHQEIQERVYEEVSGVLEPDRPPTVAEVGKLEYLERCLKETLRLFSPAPIIVRENTGHDLEISDGVIPKGASIAVSSFYMQRSELYWEDPFKYDPDRFLPDQTAKRHPYTFIPFSAGMRGCIGQRFAYMDLKTMLSTILYKYRVFCDAYKSIEDIELKSVMVIRPSKGFQFWIEERRPSSSLLL